ncbi:MAG: YhjD/YihY/BrkB family envelope integrity protein [Natrialbaceae archaeon]|nr:YhjD/YihY/BrkB family envelope integrity protein [Natrialbaceae archaeon]
MTDSERIGHILRAIGHEIQAERVTFMAASIAYNAFLSLLPLALLLLAAVTTVGSESLEATLLSLANSAMTPEAGDVLVRELERSSTEVSVLGLVVLLWGALRIFRSLDAAFSDIYETEARNTFANQLVDGLVVLVSVAAVLAVALVVLTGLPSDGAGSWVLRRMALLGGVLAGAVPDVLPVS